VIKGRQRGAHDIRRPPGGYGCIAKFKFMQQIVPAVALDHVKQQ
jgi:hypothetical protein